MDREEATRALELLRTVVKQARDDSALQNWGTIWLLHGVTNGGGFIATNMLWLRGDQPRWYYVAMWVGIVGVNIASVFLLKARRAGARTFVENQLWAIWLTFIAGVVLVDGVNEVLGFKIFTLAPVIAILSAVGFSSMGAIMGPRWFIGAAIFVAVAIAMAAVPRYQFFILGTVWGLAQIAGGIWLTLDKRAKLAEGRDAPRLV
jgi:hypothetical protein